MFKSNPTKLMQSYFFVFGNKQENTHCQERREQPPDQRPRVNTQGGMGFFFSF
jgi:hypothetical protein